jgi:hypothetical protein
MACTFTLSWPDRSTPYFSSNHLTNQLLLIPVESGANVVSTATSGRLLSTMRLVSAGVRSSLSRNAPTLTLFINYGDGAALVRVLQVAGEAAATGGGVDLQRCGEDHVSHRRAPAASVGSLRLLDALAQVEQQ